MHLLMHLQFHINIKNNIPKLELLSLLSKMQLVNVKLKLMATPVQNKQVLNKYLYAAMCNGLQHKLLGKSCISVVCYRPQNNLSQVGCHPRIINTDNHCT